ncbi:MAG: DUF4230 domain-containing protein [Chloroflexota bacterium]
MANRSPILSEQDEQKDEYEYVEVEERQGCSGCGWGLAGALGCVAIPTAVLIFVVVTGVNTVGGILDGVSSIFNPGPPVYNINSTVTVLESITELSDLTTTQYNFSNIVVAGRELPQLLRGLYRDNLTLVIVGQIEAGIDLSQLAEDDISVDGTTLVLRLPEPQLLRCFINEEQTVVVERDTGIFAAPAPNLDSEARQFAIGEFRERALENGILEEANFQAETTLRAFILSLPLAGVDSVEIVTRLPDMTEPPVLPASCR